MSRMIKFELRKLLRSKALYICAAAMVVLMMILIITFKMLEVVSQQTDIFGDMMDPLTSMMSNSGLSLMLSAVANSDFLLVMSVFVALFVCGDYSSGVIRNVMTKGYSNTDIYFSKYIATLIGSGFLLIVCFLSGFLGGTVFWNVGSGWGVRTVMQLLTQILLVISYTTVMFMIAMLFKKLVAAIAVCIFAPSGVNIALMLVDAIIPGDSFVISNYWLSGSLAKISSVNAETGTIIAAAVCSAVYLAISLTVGLLANRRSEA